MVLRPIIMRRCPASTKMLLRPFAQTVPSEEIYIIGAGGHGKVAVRAAQAHGYQVVALFDDAIERGGQTLCGVPIVGTINSLAHHPPRPTLIAIGGNGHRLALASKLAVPWLTLTHPA